MTAMCAIKIPRERFESSWLTQPPQFLQSDCRSADDDIAVSGLPLRVHIIVQIYITIHSLSFNSTLPVLYTSRFCSLVKCLLIIVFIYIPDGKVIGQDTTGINGENATLLCHLTETDDDLTRIIWKKKTRENPEETPFFVIRPGGETELKNGLKNRVQFIGNFAEKNGSIQLLRMRLLDEGIYTCTFSLFPSGPLETDINVIVFARPEVNIRGEAPVAGYLEVKLASCFASNARPEAEVMWRLGDLENSLRTETNHTINPDGTVTVVSYLLGVPLKHLNKKNIQCLVKHNNTQKEELVLDYTINIHYPPESVIIIPDSPKNAKEFRCIVDSNPEPTSYIWTRESTHYYGKKLPVPKLSPDINGLYICNASNQYGSSLGSLYISVHTETSDVCWGLFGFFICCAVLVVFGVIFRYKREWIRVLQCSSDQGVQGSGEEQRQEEDPGDQNESVSLSQRNSDTPQP
ncbi:poliovirus receptor-like [Carassius auratus]|uniref:Poliovirus receptor-like n=1 Tax=Carassius auratus TaxID=7957 RepID=A0A6P6KUF3_CARAU|nr:poliovirus receptor-like [Carassius auratus]